MKKIAYIFKEMFYMIRLHKLFFIAPLLFVLALLAILVYYVGPTVIMSFIYAGI
ncbi:MAG: DUF5989 family protein [Candidatus Omnitrophota bacterium]|jgi:hypothetical protein